MISREPLGDVRIFSCDLYINIVIMLQMLHGDLIAASSPESLSDLSRHLVTSVLSSGYSFFHKAMHQHAQFCIVDINVLGNIIVHS